MLAQSPVLETTASAETQAAHIARATTRKEAEARARKLSEAQMRGGNPHNAELTAIQHVMLMGQSVTLDPLTMLYKGASQSALLMEKLKNITINQLAQLQQFGVQLALCQAQLHMAPAISHPHIVRIDFTRSTRHDGAIGGGVEEGRREQQILAAITQAMDPNAQVAVPLSVAAANVEKEATPASRRTTIQRKGGRSEAQGRSSARDERSKKGKAAAKGKKGAKGKKAAEEVETPATESVPADKKEGC